jgi:uncharacterized protein YfdQ (DUF2303 family)
MGDHPTNYGSNNPITVAASDVHAAIDAGKNLAQVLPPVEGHRAIVFAPKTGEIKLLERDKLAAPRFLTASPVFNDPAGFILYVKDFQDPATRLFYRLDGTVVAVIDHHIHRNSTEPLRCAQPAQRHGDHIATLKLERSPEWDIWSAASLKPFGQQAFAEFLEDQIDDIIKPDPTAIVDVARGLAVTVGATLRQATNLATGEVQFSYDETVDGKVRGSSASIPTDFQIGIRPFMGSHRYPVDCKLRYRANGSDLKLHYKALHLERITETAIGHVVELITEKTGIVPALGTHDPAAFKRGE